MNHQCTAFCSLLPPAKETPTTKQWTDPGNFADFAQNMGNDERLIAIMHSLSLDTGTENTAKKFRDIVHKILLDASVGAQLG